MAQATLGERPVCESGDGGKTTDRRAAAARKKGEAETTRVRREKKIIINFHQVTAAGRGPATDRRAELLLQCATPPAKSSWAESDTRRRESQTNAHGRLGHGSSNALRELCPRSARTFTWPTAPRS